MVNLMCAFVCIRMEMLLVFFFLRLCVLFVCLILCMSPICCHFPFSFLLDVGMLAGYVLNRFKSAPAAITPFINVVLWMMSLGVMLLLVFGVWNGTLNLMWTALYVSLGHSGETTCDRNFIYFFFVNLS